MGIPASLAQQHARLGRGTPNNGHKIIRNEVRALGRGILVERGFSIGLIPIVKPLGILLD